MPSRLAQLRNDAKVAICCLAVSGLVLSSLAMQKITQAQGDRQLSQHHAQHQQAQERARLEGLADAQHRAAIESNAQGWRLWQAHISPKCSAMVSKLDRHRSYLGFTLNKTRLVYEGLIICDQNYVGILKGADLKPMWIVPRLGSLHPMPSDAPPPEFQPPTPPKGAITLPSDSTLKF